MEVNKMLEFTFKTKIKAPERDIWNMYADFDKRRQWETDLEYIKLDGLFSTGTVGVMKLADQPEMVYKLTSVIPYSQYWDRTEIPNTGIAICFGHEFTPDNDGTLLKVSAQLVKSNGEITDEDILLLSNIFSDTPMSILAIKKLVEI